MMDKENPDYTYKTVSIATCVYCGATHIAGEVPKHKFDCYLKKHGKIFRYGKDG